MPDNYYFKLSMFESIKEAESRLIQDTAFENGWEWGGTGKGYFEVTSPCLEFDPNSKHMSQGSESDMKGKYQELTRLDLVLNMLKKREYPEFKPNVWITRKNNEWSDQKYQLIRECRIEGNILEWNCYCDAETSKGDYDRVWRLDEIRTAGNDEVKNWLIEIAKKKYPIGTKVESVISNYTAVIQSYDIRFPSSRHLEYSGIYLYDAHTDKWGKIISHADPVQKIGSHEVRYEKHYISVGCLRKDIEQWKNLGHIMAEFNLKSVTHADGTSASAYDIGVLLKGYDKRKDK